MRYEFIFAGILLSPIAIACIVALVATALLTHALVRLGFYRLFWNRPLVEAALFCILLAGTAAMPLVDTRP